MINTYKAIRVHRPKWVLHLPACVFRTYWSTQSAVGSGPLVLGLLLWYVGSFDGNMTSFLGQNTWKKCVRLGCITGTVRDMENLTISAAYPAGYLLTSAHRSMHGCVDSLRIPCRICRGRAVSSNTQMMVRSCIKLAVDVL